MEALSLLEKLEVSSESSLDVNELINSFYTAMDDDFNAPILVAHLFDAVKFINSINDKKATISKEDLFSLKAAMFGFVNIVLGIKNVESGSDNKLSPVMDLVLDLRQEARANKDWGTSDKIRDGLAAAGIVVKDSKEGSSWK